MRCSQAQKMISDHVDNLLDHRSIQKLEAHMTQCKGCRNLLIEMRSLVNDAKQLETIEPNENIWPSIKRLLMEKDREETVQQKGRDLLFHFLQRPQRLAIATSMFLAVITLASLFYFGIPFIKNRTSDPSRYALSHFKVAEQHYQLAIDALNKVIADQNRKLPPELAAVFEKNLAIIDDSIRICQAAIREHPENQEANAHLMICYRKKIELLNEIRDMLVGSS